MKSAFLHLSGEDTTSELAGFVFTVYFYAEQSAMLEAVNTNFLSYVTRLGIKLQNYNLASRRSIPFGQLSAIALKTLSEGFKCAFDVVVKSVN